MIKVWHLNQINFGKLIWYANTIKFDKAYRIMQLCNANLVWQIIYKQIR